MTGAELRETREACGVPLNELARRSGCSRGHIYNVESGRSAITKAVAARFSAALGVEITPSVPRSPDSELRALREARGWTCTRLAGLALTTQRIVSALEQGKNVADADARERIMAVLADPDAERKAEAAALPRWRTPVSFDFDVGKAYLFVRKHHSLSDGLELKRMRYVGKAGRHHIFKSPSGGWVTTYTDVQLIGMDVRAAK